MATTRPPAVLRLLANDVRWSLAQALVLSDLRVFELVETIGEPMKLVSYHLQKMRMDGLVRTRRSKADGRDVYYSLNLDQLRDQYAAAGESLHPSLGSLSLSTIPMPTLLPRVLFVCTHNSARSQMAEGLMRSLTHDGSRVASAGSHPTAVHPDAVSAMASLGIDIRTQQSKPLSAFAGQSFDYVITVCDRARETCPVFPGGRQVHWGFPDPVSISDPEQRAHALADIARGLRARIAYFLMFLPAH